MYKIDLYMPVKVKLNEEGKLRADEYGLVVLWDLDYVEMTLLEYVKYFGGEEVFDNIGTSKYMLNNSVIDNIVVEEKEFSLFITHHSKKMDELSNLMQQENNEKVDNKQLIKYNNLDIIFKKKIISKEIKELKVIKDKILNMKKKQKTKQR